MTQAPEKRFTLQDGMQPVTFAGEHLASASSQVDSTPLPRWTELEIYKTVTDKYVLYKVGRSDVVHEATHTEPPNKPGKGALRYDSIMDALTDIDPEAGEDDLSAYFVPCDTCRPSFDSDQPVLVEQDMHSVDRFESAEELLDALHYRKGGAVRSLSNLSRNLLDAAARKDPDIAKLRSRPTDIS
jgi:hypothetical protein